MIYNSAFDKPKQSFNHRRKPRLFYQPKSSLNTNHPDTHTHLLPNKQSLTLYKQLEAISLEFYQPQKSQQLGLLIHKNTISQYSPYQPSKNKARKNSELLIVPILAVTSRLSPRQSKTKQSKYYRSQSNQKSCGILERAKTAKGNKYQSKEIECERIKMKTQTRMIGVEQILQKRDSLISNSSVKGGLTDTTQCTSGNIKKPDKNNFQNLLAQVSKRNGYDQHTKLFIVENRDETVRKVLFGLKGWAENPNSRSLYFNIKWTGVDSPSIFKETNPKQFINRFRNVNRLVDPSQRHQDLRDDKTLTSNYPQSFNLESSKEEFLYEYQKTAVMSLLSTHAKYITQSNIPSLLKHKNIDSLELLNSLLESRNFQSNVRLNNFLLNIPIAIQMCIYLQNMKSAIEKRPTPMQLSEETIRRVVRFSNINTPYHVLGNQHLFDQFPIIFSQDYNLFKAKNSFRTPSKSLLTLIRYYDSYFKGTKHYNNLSNIWIILSSKQPPVISRNLDVLTVRRNKVIIQKYIPSTILLQSIPQFETKPFSINYFLLIVRSGGTKIYISDQYFLQTSRGYQDPRIKSFQQEHSTSYLQSQVFQQILKEQRGVDYRHQVERNIHNFLRKYLTKVSFENQNNRFEILNVRFILGQALDVYFTSIHRIDEFSPGVKWVEDIYADLLSETPNTVFNPLRHSQSSKWRLLLSS